MSASLNIDLHNMIRFEFIPLVQIALRKGTAAKEYRRNIDILAGLLAKVLADKSEKDVGERVRRLQYHLRFTIGYSSAAGQDITQHLLEPDEDVLDGERFLDLPELWTIWDDLAPRLEAFADTLLAQVDTQNDAHNIDAEPRDLGSASAAWHTVSEAATIAGCDKGVISRAAERGELESNGKKGRERRIAAAALTAWILDRAKRPEQTESYEAVERKLQQAGRK